jgi:hypothetical protein
MNPTSSLAWAEVGEAANCQIIAFLASRCKHNSAARANLH